MRRLRASAALLQCACAGASPQAGLADAGVLGGDWPHDDCPHHSGCTCKVLFPVLLLLLLLLLVPLCSLLR